MSTTRHANIDVLIQGAGIGGLTLAIALLQRGYSVQLVERSSGLSEIGAGIWMAANPMQVFDRLGFAGKVAAAGWPVQRIFLKDYRGDTLEASDLRPIAQRFGFETVALHRSVLQKVLFNQLPPGIVAFGASVEELHPVEDAIQAQLTNGSSLTAKIVVGADGINSRIREFISLGGEKRYSGSSSYRGIARGARLASLEDHDAYEIWAPGCRVGFSRINAQDYYWYMTFDSPAGLHSSPDQRRSHADSLFRTYFPQWIGLLESTETEEVLHTDISDLKRLRKWSSGRVGLIGDAAHATTPNLGQGGAMAIEDALSLANSFQQAGLNADAWEIFEKQRRKKVDWIVATSWSIGKICHIRNRFGCSLRNIALKQVLSKMSHRDSQIRKLYAIDEIAR